MRNCYNNYETGKYKVKYLGFLFESYESYITVKFCSVATRGETIAKARGTLLNLKYTQYALVTKKELFSCFSDVQGNCLFVFICNSYILYAI